MPNEAVQIKPEAAGPEQADVEPAGPEQVGVVQAEVEQVGPEQADLLHVEKIVVQAGRILIDVRVASDAATMTLPRAAALMRACPGIQTHACKNNEGTTLASVLDHTSTAHALEHVIIHLQTQAALAVAAGGAAAESSEGANLTFVGNTRSYPDDPNLFHLEVNFFDDLVALAALKRGAELLNAIVRAC